MAIHGWRNNMEYGLIGEKLGHSYSKIIQEKLLEDYTYEIHPIEKEDLDAFMKAKAFKGINVTIPYKQSVIPYLDEMDEAAKKIGAVNTIVNKDGLLKGYNTDYYGFLYTLDKNNIEIKDKKVLVVGDGGASKAIQAAVLAKHPKQLIITNRTPHENTISMKEVYVNHTDCDVIINTTSVGMYPNIDNNPIDVSKFSELKAVIDIIYNPLCTKFLLQGKELGIPYVNGLEMLVAQAKYALEHFKDISIEDSEINRIYKELLKTI